MILQEPNVVIRKASHRSTTLNYRQYANLSRARTIMREKCWAVDTTHVYRTDEVLIIPKA